MSKTEKIVLPREIDREELKIEKTDLESYSEGFFDRFKRRKKPMFTFHLHKRLSDYRFKEMYTKKYPLDTQAIIFKKGFFGKKEVYAVYRKALIEDIKGNLHIHFEHDKPLPLTFILPTLLGLDPEGSSALMQKIMDSAVWNKTLGQLSINKYLIVMFIVGFAGVIVFSAYNINGLQNQIVSLQNQNIHLNELIQNLTRGGGVVG